MGAGAVAVPVLAEVGGVGACIVKPSGDRRAVESQPLELLVTPIRWGVARYLGVVGVLAAQERRTTRAAQGIGDEGVVEGGALLDQQGLELGHHGDRPGVQVVSEDEDYVGALLLDADFLS